MEFMVGIDPVCTTIAALELHKLTGMNSEISGRAIRYVLQSVMAHVLIIFLTVVVSFQASPAFGAGSCADLFRKHPNEVSEQAQEFLRPFIEEINNKIWSWSDNKAQVSARVELSTATKGEVSQIVPQYNKRGAVFTLRINPQLIQSPGQVYKDIVLLRYITHFANEFSKPKQKDDYPWFYFPSAHALAEILSNAAQGSARSRLRWLTIEQSLLQNSKAAKDDQQAFSNFIQGSVHLQHFLKLRLDELAKLIPEALIESQRETEAGKLAWEKWKVENGNFEQIEVQTKLADLVMANDRAGTRRLIEHYLPWPMMEPVEARGWKVWLDAIEHPSSTQTVVAFRGLSEERGAELNNLNLTRQLPDGTMAYGLLSPVLTLNSTNPTRNLRVLENKHMNSAPTLTGLMSQHSIGKGSGGFKSQNEGPIGSSFLSFTYEPWVTKTYLSEEGAMIAVKVDSRRLFPNRMNDYTREVELLAPLVIFPDEVLFIHKGRYKDDDELNADVQAVNALTGWKFEPRQSYSGGRGPMLLQTRWITDAVKERYFTDGSLFLQTMMNLSRAPDDDGPMRFMVID